MVTVWLSFAPSLWPRGAITRGVVGGIGAAIGYGLGALVDREPRPGTPRVWRATALLGVVGTLAAVLLGRYFQVALLAPMGAPSNVGWRVVLAPVVGAAVAMALVSARDVTDATWGAPSR